MKTYQQVYIYLIPILGNLGFINIFVVVIRLRWFEKRLKAVGAILYFLKGHFLGFLFADISRLLLAPHLLRPQPSTGHDAEAQLQVESDRKDVPGPPRTQVKQDESQKNNEVAVEEVPENPPRLVSLAFHRHYMQKLICIAVPPTRR